MKSFVDLPTIAICMPTLNQGAYIEESIESILSQRYPNLEFIVMDGGSSDNTLEIINKYSRFIRYWRSGRDAGQSAAINTGLDYSRADIFAWLNSDDVLLANALFKVAQAWRDGHSFIAGQSAFRDMSGKSVVWRVTNLPMLER